MKYVFYFFLFFTLGILSVFAYKNITIASGIGELKSPLAQFPFSLDVAPSQSLKGTAFPLKDEVFWQSRIATVPAKISKPKQIQQGEEIVTKDQGQASVTFKDMLDLFILPKTEVDFVQTLPENIVINQNSGSVQYSKLGESPVSIRSLSLLVTILKGEVTISVDENQTFVTAEINKGSISVGYNDSRQITQTFNVSEGKRLIFNNYTKKIFINSL